MFAKLGPVALFFLSSLLTACGPTPQTPVNKPAAPACPYEDLSVWQGAKPGWSMDGNLWLTFGTGCQGKAVVANALIGLPDSLRLYRPLVLQPEGFVRVIATLQVGEGIGPLYLEVRDTQTQWTVIAEPNREDIAEIKTWIPSGQGEIIVHAWPSHEGTFGVTVSNVIVESQ